MASGEKHAMRQEQDSLEECYANAQWYMERIAEDFEHRAESRIDVACSIRKVEEKSKWN
jgi:hypothetical protein